MKQPFGSWMSGPGVTAASFGWFRVQRRSAVVEAGLRVVTVQRVAVG